MKYYSVAEDHEEERSLLRGESGNKNKSKIIGSCGMPKNDPRNQTTMPPIFRTTRKLHTGEGVELGPGQFNRTLLIYVGTVGLMLKNGKDSIRYKDKAGSAGLPCSHLSYSLASRTFRLLTP